MFGRLYYCTASKSLTERFLTQQKLNSTKLLQNYIGKKSHKSVSNFLKFEQVQEGIKSQFRKMLQSQYSFFELNQKYAVFRVLKGTVSRKIKGVKSGINR